MKALGSPAGIAIVALLLAAAAHPAFDLTSLGSTGTFALPLLSLLFLLAVGVGARGAGIPAALLAVGVSVALGAVAYDAVRGRSGRLTLRPEQGTTTFEEEGPGGAVLGLRPLGFELQLTNASADGARLSISAAARTLPAVLIGPRESVAEGGLRLGWRGYDDSPRLEVSLTRGDERLDFDLSGATPASVDATRIGLVRSFPELAIDDQGQPYSRSAEFRNPAALLQVSRGDRTWPIFVLRSVSGPQEFNQIPELGWTFGLTSMAADPRLMLGVHQEPAALAAAVGLAFALAGLALGLRR